MECAPQVLLSANICSVGIRRPDVRRFSTLRNRVDISPIGAARKGVLFDTDLLAHKLNDLSNLAKEARVVLRRRITRECEDVL